MNLGLSFLLNDEEEHQDGAATPLLPHLQQTIPVRSSALGGVGSGQRPPAHPPVRERRFSMSDVSIGSVATTGMGGLMNFHPDSDSESENEDDGEGHYFRPSGPPRVGPLGAVDSAFPFTEKIEKQPGIAKMMGGSLQSNTFDLYDSSIPVGGSFPSHDQSDLFGSSNRSLFESDRPSVAVSDRWTPPLGLSKQPFATDDWLDSLEFNNRAKEENGGDTWLSQPIKSMNSIAAPPLPVEEGLVFGDFGSSDAFTLEESPSSSDELFASSAATGSIFSKESEANALVFGTGLRASSSFPSLTMANGNNGDGSGRLTNKIEESTKSTGIAAFDESSFWPSSATAAGSALVSDWGLTDLGRHDQVTFAFDRQQNLSDWPVLPSKDDQQTNVWGEIQKSALVPNPLDSLIGDEEANVFKEESGELDDNFGFFHSDDDVIRDENHGDNKDREEGDEHEAFYWGENLHEKFPQEQDFSAWSNGFEDQVAEGHGDDNSNGIFWNVRPGHCDNFGFDNDDDAVDIFDVCDHEEANSF
jgi:hypothetical protein